MHQRRWIAVALLTAVATANAQPSGGQRAAFVVTLGGDTLAVERFVRTPTSLVGDLLLRAPRTRVLHYEASLDQAGAISHIELITQAVIANQIPRPTRIGITFRNDTAVMEMQVRDSTRTMRVRAPGAVIPFVNLSFALYEAAVMHARRAGRDTMRVALVTPGDQIVRSTTVTRRGADSVLIDYFGSPIRARVDGDGRIASADARETTQKVVVARIDDADIDFLAQLSAQADARGSGMGNPSPRDTVRADVGGARVIVDYGRPRKRGRVVFGGAEAIEPWGRVWRTGANAATQIETTADLTIGNALVPAGKYTLWTLLSPTAPMLIVNKQTGQWGTEYRAEQDLVRIPMTIATLPSVVEQFVIAIDATGGMMRLRWDTTEFSVPIAKR
jgi:hypothetical protein